MFICFFVCLFIYGFVFFALIIMGHPQEVSLKDSLISDLTWPKYLGSKNVYLLADFLFVYGFVCFFFLIILGYPKEVSLKAL